MNSLVNAPYLRIPVRVKLPEEASARLKSKARLRQVTASIYARAILHHALHQAGDYSAAFAPVVGAPTDVYFNTEVGPDIRARLEEWSDRHAANVAVFCGFVVGEFLERHEQDPRDLLFGCELDELLARRERLKAEELAALVRQNAPVLGAGINETFAANWLFQRLRHRVPDLESEGGLLKLSPQWIKPLLAKEE